MRSFLCLLILLVIASGASGKEDAVRVLAELRAKGHFREADEYAVEQWQRGNLSDRSRAELAIQRALIYTEWALATSPMQAELWSKADEVCEAFLKEWPDNPRGTLVAVQRGLVWLARGQQARELQHPESAREHLRGAARRLAEVYDAVERALVERQLRPASNLPPDALTPRELESVAANVLYHRARCQHQLGLCYPQNSPDRDAALLQSVEQLTPLARRMPADEVTWNARVELARSLRGLGRRETAQRLVNAWLQETPPEGVAARLAAQTSPSEASAGVAVLVENDSDGGESDARLRGAAAAREAGRQAEASELYRRIALHRADDPQAAGAHQLAILCMADVLRHAPPAQRAAFAATYRSLLEEHLARWPNERPSDEVRLWLGQFLAARGEWTPAIDVLHAVRPSSTLFHESLSWLLHCHEALLRGAAGDAEGGAEGRAKRLSAATHSLQPIITGAENRWPDPWSDAQRETAWQLARLHLRYSDGPSPYAERLLTAAIHGKREATKDAKDSDWQARAELLLVEALVRTDKWAEAGPLADRLPEVPPALLLETLASIDQAKLHAASSIEGTERRAVGEIMLRLVRHAEKRQRELDSEALERLGAFRASALAAAGKRAAALAQYAAMATKLPDDGDVQERYAALLASSESEADLREALQRWQRVESRSRRGDARWRRARRARIELLSRLGDAAAAEKLLRLTRLLYPKWSAGATSAE